MNRRLLVAVVVMALATLILAGLFTTRAQITFLKPEPADWPRYQVVAGTHTILIDTTTGDTWRLAKPRGPLVWVEVTGKDTESK